MRYQAGPVFHLHQCLISHIPSVLNRNSFNHKFICSLWYIQCEVNHINYYPMWNSSKKKILYFKFYYKKISLNQTINRITLEKRWWWCFFKLTNLLLRMVTYWLTCSACVLESNCIRYVTMSSVFTRDDECLQKKITNFLIYSTLLFFSWKWQKHLCFEKEKKKRNIYYKWLSISCFHHYDAELKPDLYPV